MHPEIKTIVAMMLVMLLGILQLHSQTITEEEYELIESVLKRANLDIESLNFEKDWDLSSKLKIPLIVKTLNEPMEYPIFADSIQDLMRSRDMATISEYFGYILFEGIIDENFSLNSKSEKYSEFYFEDYIKDNVRKSKDLFRYGEYLFELTDSYYQQAMDKLTEQDKDALTYLSYSMWTDTNDWQRYENEELKEYRELFKDMKYEDYQNIITKIDWEAFLKANRLFVNGATALKNNVQYINFSNRKPLEKNTKWGRFIIGTQGSDTYSSDKDNVVFLIDPAGDDIYYNDFVTDFDNPFYLALDMGGNDIWRNNSTRGLFSVVGGIGWSASLGGNDFYEAGDFAFSSFVGFQYHTKESPKIEEPESEDEEEKDKKDDGIDKGRNYYNTGRYSQGAATFGLSVNINDGGNNIYNITGYGQGFGGTLGAGLLIDYDGHDVYYAGGKYLHKPLRPEDHRSMAQGFGFGVRSDWGGGIGILYDENGNDSYTGAVYAQGVGYWYALGMLLDGGGNDTYRAVQYAQGSGIHLAGGFLYNKSGDDSYYSRFGPGQGAGHDFAIGFMIDRDGDDHYSIDGGNGLGLTNSVGFFLDVDGNDRYERANKDNYGYANEARESGGIGIFLDTGGKNVYSDTLRANDKFWINGKYGIGLDTTYVKVEEEEKKEEELNIEAELAEIDTMTVVADLFRIAAEWEVGSSVERVRRARKRILDFQEEAAQYIYENKFNSQSGLEHRAILAFAQASEHFAPYIKMGLNHEDSLVVKNSIGFTANLQQTDLLYKLDEFLEKKMYIPNTILAFSAFKTDETAEKLIPFMTSPSERIRFHTARCLNALRTEKSKELLEEMKKDRSFLVRMVAIIALPDKEE